MTTMDQDAGVMMKEQHKQKTQPEKRLGENPLFIFYFRRLKMIRKIAVLLCILIMTSVASANVTTIQSFPDTIYGGSSGTGIFSITGTNAVQIDVHIYNNEFAINYTETDVNIFIDSKYITCTETTQGYFVCEESQVNDGSTIKIEVSMVPNIIPDNNYTYAIMFNYNEQTETIVHRRGGGGGGGSRNPDTDMDGILDRNEIHDGTDWKNPCDPNTDNDACRAFMKSESITPSPEPTHETSPESEITPETPPEPPVKTPMETSTPTPIPSKIPNDVLIYISCIIISIVIVVLWYKRQ